MSMLNLTKNSQPVPLLRRVLYIACGIYLAGMLVSAVIYLLVSLLIERIPYPQYTTREFESPAGLGSVVTVHEAHIRDWGEKVYIKNPAWKSKSMLLVADVSPEYSTSIDRIVWSKDGSLVVIDADMDYAYDFRQHYLLQAEDHSDDSRKIISLLQSRGGEGQVIR